MSMKTMLALAAALSVTALPALAANPFSDVPEGHWAYSAAEDLSARGLLDGYPDGSFRGSRVMTRYEIAKLTARMIARQADLPGASAEKLKTLMAEFRPELEALGVKVDSIDSRLSRLEKNLQGWKISGEMVFDYRGGNKDFTGDHGFEFDTADIFLRKELSDGVSFDAMWKDGTFDQYFVTAEGFLGMGWLTAKVGQFEIDWEADDGLYHDEHEDAGNFMGYRYRGALLTGDFGLGEISAFAASNRHDDGGSVYGANEGGEYWGLRVKANLSDRFWLSGNTYTAKPESDEISETDFRAYWVGAGFKLTEGAELSGAYYWQKDIGADVSSADAWKVALKLSQDLLKVTSLRAEYSQFDRGFAAENWAYSFFPQFGDVIDADMFSQGKVKAFMVAARQEWGEKWSTFERFAQYRPDEGSSVKDWGAGIGYQYSPSLSFELAYNRIDAGDGTWGLDGFKEGDFVRFRTCLSF